MHSVSCNSFFSLYWTDAPTSGYIFRWTEAIWDCKQVMCCIVLLLIALFFGFSNTQLNNMHLYLHTADSMMCCNANWKCIIWSFFCWSALQRRTLLGVQSEVTNSCFYRSKSNQPEATVDIWNYCICVCACTLICNMQEARIKCRNLSA